MRALPLFSVCVLSAALLNATAIAQEAAVAARIVNPLDEKQLVTLKGTIHPLANAGNDRGAAPDEMRLDRIHLVLKRSDSQEAALRKLIADMHTPGTASYHKWLTPDAFGKQFGPADQDIAAVETWLAGHGFSVTKVNPGKQTIEIAGNAGQFRSAFHAQIHKYEVNGETHYANAADPQIPAALAPLVGGFVTLNNFRARSAAKYLGKAQYDPKTDHAIPSWTRGGGAVASDNFVLAPQDFAVQYDLNPLYTAGTNGTGQSIAIVNESNINVALVNNFRTLFGLPANPPQVIIDGNDPGVDGINNPDGLNGASVEAYLDVEWAGAVAPDATVYLVIGGDTVLESGLILAAEHAVYGNVAPVMSLSFQACEGNLGNGTSEFLSGLWEQAAAQGITVMVASGDAGSAACDNDDTAEYAQYGQAVNGFASTPYNVAVGGTDFYYSDFSKGLTAMEAQMGTYWSTTASNSAPAVSIKGVIPEQPWNGSQYGLTLATLENPSPTSTNIEAGGGGASGPSTTKPAWQTGFGDTARDLPDLSLYASNGWNGSYYPICAVDGDCQPVSNGAAVQISGVGGTSASSPAFAGIMALVNQKYGRQGQADFVLYPLSQQFPAAFNDVVNGTNTVPCQVTTSDCITVSNPVSVTDPTTGSLVTEGEIGSGTTAWYNATAGYDEASGLGTVDASQLVNDWNKVTFAGTTTTLTPSMTSFTHGTAITISGSVTAASGTPTGDVALMTSSSEPGEQSQGLTAALNGEASTFPLISGAFSGPVYTLPGGTYSIWGQYGGDTLNAESASTPVSITVSPESSGIYLQAVGPTGDFGLGQTVDYGTQLQLTAQVAPSSMLSTVESCGSGCSGIVYTKPTGVVAFADAGKPLNNALINAEGAANYNAPFALGSHSVTASYGGDSSYMASSAPAVTFTVVQDNPNIFLGASNETSDTQLVQVVGGTGQPTVFNILVENGAQSSNPVHKSAVSAPSGTVTVNGFPAGVPTSATLTAGVDPSTGAVAGIATITVPASTPAANYNVTISYGGDANYAPVPTEYGTVQIVSNGLTPSTTSASISGSVSPTTSVTVTGTVTGTGSKAPTGDVYAYSSGNYIAGAVIAPGSGDVSAFSFVLNSQALSQGANFVTIQYFGDKTYNPSAYMLGTPISNPLSDFTLVPASPIVSLAPGGNGSTSINLASINGFSGAVSLTCTPASGVTCSIPSSESLASGGMASATLSVSAASSTASGSYDVLITGKDPTGKHLHTLGIKVVVSAGLGFSLTNSGGITIAHGATTGNTVTIGATPTDGFTGVINLSCAVTVTPGQVTSPVTCNIPASVNITGSSLANATLTVASVDATTQGAYSIQVTGRDAATGKLNSTTIVYVTIIGLTPTVTVTSSATTITEAQSFQITVTVTGSGGTATGVIDLAGPTSGGELGASLTNGSYIYNLPPGTFTAGTDVLSIRYSGDAVYAAGSGATTVTVNKVAPTLTVTASPTTLYTNQSLTVSGTLSGAGGTSPTGTVTLTSGNYTSGPTAIVGGSYSIVIPGGSLSAGTDTLTLNYSGDSEYNSASKTAQVTVTQFALLTPTVTLSVPSTVDSTGSLTLSGTVSGTGATPTGSVQVQIAGNFPPPIVLVNGAYSYNVAASTLPLGLDAVTVNYSGDDTYATGSAVATFTVAQAVFALTATSPAALTPGQGANSTITVSTSTGYQGVVTVACSLTASPAGAIDLPTCAAGGQVALGPGSSGTASGTTTVSVTTTAASTGELVYPNMGGKGRGWAGAGGGAVLALLLFLGIPARRRSWRSMLGMIALMAILGSLAACGGGGSGGGGGGGGGGNSGTTAGAYTFTVTATGSPAQSANNTATFTVTVN